MMGSPKEDKCQLVTDDENSLHRKYRVNYLLLALFLCMLLIFCTLIKLIFWSPPVYILKDPDPVMHQFHTFAYPSNTSVADASIVKQDSGLPQDFFMFFSTMYASFTSKKQIPEETKSEEIVDRPMALPSINVKLDDQCGIGNDDRFDCFPEDGASQQKCEARGCCWVPTNRPLLNRTLKAYKLDVPWCFYPRNYQDYYILNYTETKTGILAYLARNGSSYYPNDVPLLRMDVEFLGFKHLHMRISDPTTDRYEVPYPKINKPLLNFEYGDMKVDVKYPRDIIISHKHTSQQIFNLSGSAFIFTDQFIQVSFKLSSKYVYGLGGRRDTFLRSVNWQQFTMFAADQMPRDNSNLYGSHPFFLMQNKLAPSVGVMLLNSNAMDVILQPTPAITYRTLGGILDFHIFAGETPAEVISSYTDAIGLPELPPYWSLGFHLCRFGYNSANNTRDIWQKTRDAGIPFDVQWNDIDYMDHRRDFTYDKTNFSNLPAFVDDIHKAGMHYVIIIDPAIDIPDVPGTYAPYDEGVQQDIFIKNSTGDLFVGKVWSPNGAAFPDFTDPKIEKYWTDQLRDFHSQIPYDGLWIDMNEPANFLNGQSNGCPETSVENPPYVPNVNGGQLRFKTLCMTAKQHASTHYNVHNLYGFSEAINSNKALKSILQKRPFIISRSTFIGHGHYAGHWTGDILSSWDDMQRTIPGILDFGLFGVPMVGADICGFNGNSTAKLCQRWMELGAFYPFSRNHNTDNGIPQDPVSFGPDVVRASVKALRTRYLFLPYLYTLFYRASVYGETVARPLFFEFPQDEATYGIDTHFLWGSAFLILPVLQEDVTKVDYYIPKGTWYMFEDFETKKSNGEVMSIDTPLDTIHVALRGGYILPVQPVQNTTTQSRKMKFGLMAALDENENAVGQLYWDDGDSLETLANENYNLLNFIATKGNLTSQIVTYGASDESMTLGAITALGVINKPTTVNVNGQALNFTYSEDKKILMVTNMTVPMNAPFTVLWK